MNELLNAMLKVENVNSKGVHLVGKEDIFYSYSEILQRASNIAYQLQAVIGEDSTVMFIHNRTDVVIMSLWACTLSGVVAVPLSANSVEGYRELFHLWDFMDNPFILTSNECVNDILHTFDSSVKEKLINIDEIEEMRQGEIIDRIGNDEVALIMFSSGTTGQPKGITLTPNNIFSAAQAMRKHIALSDHDIFLNWMPLTHVIGLNLFHFVPLFNSLDQYLINYDVFLEDPNVWMQKISQYRATITISANFGFNLLVKSWDINENEHLDLSCLKVVFASAEPVSADAINNFVHLLSPYGLSFKRIKNLYGMTESVLGITATGINDDVSILNINRDYLSVGDKVIYATDGDKENHIATIVSSGIPLSSAMVRICDHHDVVLAHEVIGHIHTTGAGITKQYYHIDNDEFYTPDGWLRTGDIGFIRNETNELIIVGRQKETIIVNGRNFYCSDLDKIIMRIDGIATGDAIVCSVFSSELKSESVIVFFKCQQVNDVTYINKLRNDIRREMAISIGIQVKDVIPVSDIPKTKSGKVKRNDLAKQYLAGEFDQTMNLLAQGEHSHSSSGQQRETKNTSSLSEICRNVLALEELNNDIDLFLMGLDSISMIQIISRVNNSYHCNLSVNEFVNNSSVNGLASIIEKNKKQNKFVYPKIVPEPEKIFDLFPVTPIQSAYLLGRNQEFEIGGIGTHFYHEIETRVDLTTLNKNLNKIIKEIPSMRTIFDHHGQQRIINDNCEYHLNCSDISMLDKEQQKNRIESIRTEMSHQLFALDQWPLFEFRGLRLSDQVYYLFVSIDLLIADAASVFKLGCLLADMSNNPQFIVEHTDLTIRDYINACQELKQSSVYQEDKAYWLEKLSTFPEAPNLPYQVLPESIKRPVYQRLKFDLNKDKWDLIKQKAKSKRITPSAALCTAFAYVLAFWSNQQSLALNLTAFNRHPFHEDVDKLFGDFTTVIPLDLCLDDQTDFWHTAQQTQAKLYDALEHRHYDGVEFIQELSKYNHYEFGKAVLPIVFSSILFERGRYGWSELGEVKYAVSQTPQVFIDCQAIEDQGAVSITWDYVENLFDQRMITEMFSQYSSYIEGLLDDQPGLDHFIQNDEQFTRYNDTDEEMTESNLCDLINKSFARYPDLVAVEFGNHSISYAQLDAKSNQVANYLIENNIRKGSSVGVLAERQIESIINIIGILKAGAAYVPIDPIYPEERQKYILENSDCQIILMADSIEKLDIGKYNEQLNQIIAADANDTAYVIYTSGSTGRPKGVEISHGAVTNTIVDINKKNSINHNDKVIGLSSMCFDLSVYDIFGTLSSGATLVLIEDQRNLSEIDSVIKQKGITIWNSVPAIMDMYIDNIDLDSDEDLDEQEVLNLGWESQLRIVMLSGDWIPVGLPKKIVAKFDQAQVISLGGATEASIWSIYYPITNVDLAWKSIPYGIPLANQKIYILNYAGELCPIDVKGEICIGGKGLATGYKNDREKTNAAFVNHPQYGRIYLTGDQGVLRADSYIEFKGRNDEQVKIRGYRIELGEINKRLTEYVGIKKAAVVDWDKDNGEKYLCAYVICDQELDIAAIRTFLALALPEYMIPTYFVKVDDIPLSSNGKINKKALSKPDHGGFEKLDSYVAPTNQFEAKLTTLWAELLHLDRVGTHDNFFEIGGNSLIMVQLGVKIHQEFKVNIGLKEILQHNKIVLLAKAIANKTTSIETVLYPQIQHNEMVANDPFMLTDVQMAYLIGRGLEYELGGVSTHFYLELENNYDLPRLTQCIRILIARHPMLRCIALNNGQQQILPSVPDYSIEVVDLTAYDHLSQNEIILNERDKRSHYVYQPEEWPLFGFKAFKRDEALYCLQIDIDMFITDGAGINILCDELVKLYRNPDVSLPDIEVTFRDYMEGYVQIKQGEAYRKDKAFWMDKLHRFPSAPHLPIKKQLDAVRKPQFIRLDHFIPMAQWRQIELQCSAHQVTPAVALCTAYASVLAYWSNQSELAINTTIFNRYPLHPDVNKIVGDFTSVLPIGISFDQEGFWNNASDVQIALADAIEHRHYDGIEFIRELAKVNNYESTKAILPVVFTSMLFGNSVTVDNKVYNIDGLKVAVSQTSQVYLDHQVMELNDGISLTWDYIDELFDKNVIEKMFSQYIDLIDSLTHDRPYQIKDDFIVNFVNHYNDTMKEFEFDHLYDLLVHAFTQFSTNTAVEFGDNSISYAQLDANSNKIANYLWDQGLQQGDRIGILGIRKIESIINIIGILKAGGVYVPIDPIYPQERQDYMMQDSGCRDLLSPESYSLNNIDEYNVSLKKKITTLSSDSAYIIYTSGSTGKPKGVEITHGAVTNTIIDINQKFSVNAKDKIIGLSSMCFDLSVYDIFGALASGATLVLIEDQRDTNQIGRVMKEKGITIWNSVPAIMNMYLASVEGDSDAQYRAQDREEEIVNLGWDHDLRLVLLSGDWIPIALPEKIHEQFEHAEVVSLGGATEASIWSIYYPITTVNPFWVSIPYGIPLANQQIYILNYDLNLCPIGVKGEIYIGGLGVAKGYKNDSEKTADAFINHPKYGRIYRTGDQGIFNQEGYVEFAGRNDEQVKIRGYRIELGEINKRISEYDGVKNAVVVDWPYANGEKYLCAYMVTDLSLDVDSIRKFLAVTLPEYMIPTYYVKTEQIPLSSNGKINRHVLLPPDYSSIESTNPYIAPVGKTELILTNIWREVLQVDRVGTGDNFYDLGGNSLLMVQIISRIAKELNVNISFRELLECKTAGQLSKLIAGKTKSTAIVNYRQIEKDELNLYEPFPLTDVQLSYLLGRNDSYELGGISTHVYIEIETALDISLLNQGLQMLINQHEMLRAIILPTGEQRILENIPLYSIEVIDISLLLSDQKEEVIFNERNRMSHHVFDPEVWPLFEFKAFMINQDKHYLCVGIDMLIADGASIQMIFQELYANYCILKQGQPQKQQPLNISFRDYMLAYMDDKKSERYQSDQTYWLNRLADFPEAPNLPYRMAITEVKEPVFVRQAFNFDQISWDKLVKVCKLHQITPAIAIFTAYAKVLSIWSNQQEIAVNTTIFNRFPYHEQVNSIIGDFTAVLPIAIDCNADYDFWSLATTLQGVMADAMEHRHYDGVEFIRELGKYQGYQPNKAILPVVFTSMLFGNSMDINNNGVHLIGEVKESVSQTSQVYLDHQIMEVADGISITWDYVKELFEEKTIASMFTQYINTLKSVIDGNESPFDEIVSGLDLIIDYNNTDQSFESCTLIELLTKSFRTYDAKIAIELGNSHISYTELDRLSNQVANYLLEQSIEKGNCVGVLVERRIESIVNIIGILKAGASYVPVDPNYPEERQQYILDNSGCRLILTANDIERLGINKYDQCLNQNIIIEAADTAYIIYTSGSTGKPKGVEISHGAVTNTIVDINHKFAVNCDDKLIGLSSMCFDLSVYDIFGALSCGATLVLIEDQRDVSELDQTIKEKGITIWNSVPAIMDMYIENTQMDSDREYWEQDLEEEVTYLGWENQLRLVLLSGDWIPLGLPGKITNKFEQAQVVSLGGATEASIWSIYYPITEVKLAWKSIPYGIPLANQKIYILNYAGDLCQLGVMGEICIGGVGLAKGYKNDPEKTEAVFVDHPQLGQIYLTGDQGILREDGYVEFMGRNDEQVKIRGYRIELGEINQRLAAYEGIKKSVIVDWDHASGGKYLCAYLVCDEEIDIQLIRHFLSETLPDYMIPSYFIKVDEIPLSANGKVNKRILKQPDQTQIDGSVNYVAPINEVERKLTEIWGKLLQVPKVGTKDNFFDLGGNSITLINMHKIIEQLYPGKLKLIDIFQQTTISQIAQLIVQSSQTELILEPIKIPEAYLSDEQSEQIGRAVFKFSIDSETINNLLNMAEKNGVRIESALVSSYLYLLSEQFGLNAVSILEDVNGNHDFNYIRLNLNEYNSIEQLIKRVDKDMQNTAWAFPINKDHVSFSAPDLVLPLLFNLNNHQMTGEMLEKIGLGVGYQRDDLKRCIDVEVYLGDALDQDKCNDLPSLFSKIIIAISRLTSN